jgi:hypothetical protein
MPNECEYGPFYLVRPVTMAEPCSLVKGPLCTAPARLVFTLHGNTDISIQNSVLDSNSTTCANVPVHIGVASCNQVSQLGRDVAAVRAPSTAHGVNADTI